MPTSIDPEPAENEFECANCGAYFHYELTRCPNCGINLYEPEDETETTTKRPSPPGAGVLNKLKDAFHKIFNKPYAADEIFGEALDASILYNDLLQKVGGDRAIVERLIEFEQVRAPQSIRREWIKSACQRWARDNSHSGPSSSNQM